MKTRISAVISIAFLMGALAVLMLMTALVSNANAQERTLESIASNGKKPVTQGIVIITNAIPKEGINVVYKYHDLTSGTSGLE